MTATKIALAREEGETMGEAKGRANGRLEEKHEMSRKLVALGDDTSRISPVTGLSEEEIRALMA